MLYRFRYLEDTGYKYVQSWNYGAFVQTLGNVLVEVTDSDYQGDTRILFKALGKYGFLVIGWGSCSGCDALQGCDTLEELFNLFDALRNDIKWFDTLQEAKDYISSDINRELEHYYHEDEWLDFKEQVLAVNG